MKLNAEILMFELGRKFQCQCLGQSREELLLIRPRLFSEKDRCLKENHVYVADSSLLPRELRLENNTVLVAVGQYLPEGYKEQGSCIWVSEGSVPEVFNTLQDVWDQYDAWTEKLDAILYSTASIQEMIESSQEILDGYLTVIDRKYRYLAKGNWPGVEGLAGETNVDVDNLLLNFQNVKRNSYSRQPFFTEDEMGKRIHIDIFREGEFAANLTVNYTERNPQGRDVALLQYLADYLQKAMEKPQMKRNDQRSILREVLQQMVQGKRVRGDLLEQFRKAGTAYTCVKMQLDQQLKRISGGYVCEVIESLAPGSLSFFHEGTVVSFIDNDRYVIRESASSKLEAFIEQTSLQAGISYVCHDLAYAWYYYRQACEALERGTRTRPNGNYYFFQDYALEVFLEKGLGDVPLETMLPEGLFRLLEHDRQSETSYAETLAVYLKHNQNVVQTARELFIHRSTLNTRLKRIQALLQMDLEDVRERLHLQILMELLDGEKSNGGKGQESLQKE